MKQYLFPFAIIILAILMVFDRSEITARETDYSVHIILDVAGREVSADGNLILIVEMPDGTFHGFEVLDAPLGEITLVCLETTDQDNYEAYKVVAIR